MNRTKPLLVIGHKNPDTDSICSAIGYAEYKTHVSKDRAVACRAGNINAHTRFVLDSFAAADPVQLADVFPRLSDVMIPHHDAGCVGRVTALGIAGLLERLESADSPTVPELMACPVRDFLEPTGPVFAADTTIRDAEGRVNRSNEGDFVVTDESGAITGIVTRMNFMTDSKFRIALVDHNEFSQSVDGIEAAQVEEIIDHHRIGMHRTNEPITVINRVVGSTCTIVADIFRQTEHGMDAATTGFLLSGLLSDTVVLNSPTATPLDHEIARWLAERAEVRIDAYGREMFAAGGVRNAENWEDGWSPAGLDK